MTLRNERVITHHWFMLSLFDHLLISPGQFQLVDNEHYKPGNFHIVSLGTKCMVEALLNFSVTHVRRQETSVTMYINKEKYAYFEVFRTSIRTE